MNLAFPSSRADVVHPDSLRGLNFFNREQYQSAGQGALQSLPIDPFIPRILETIETHQVTIVVAETGAGKSTRVPAALMKRGEQPVVTQPRRMAARALATRVAAELGEPLGKTVGYKTALDGVTSPDTRLLYCTDGLALVKELNACSQGRGILVIDEVHEFNLNIEVLLAWSRLKSRENPRFKLVIMSATMEQERLASYFGGAPVVNVPGRQHSITELATDITIQEAAVEHLRSGRSVLIFEPGKKEIEARLEAISKLYPAAVVLPLHADLLPEEQDRCLQPTAGPKCVIATNIAETSLTIPDIDVVLDCGTERRIEIRDGVEGLYVRPISLANRAQRKGRAGRTKPGFYMDYCPVPLDKRVAFPVPEIMRTFLDQAALRLARQGLDIEKLSFFHQPERPLIRQAKQCARFLGCLTDNLTVTDRGVSISELPVSLRTGRMLLEAYKRGVSDDVITAVSLIETGVIHQKNEAGSAALLAAGDRSSDIISQMNLFKIGCEVAARHAADPRDCKQQLELAGIVPRLFFKVLETRHHIADMFGARIDTPASTGNKEDIVMSLIAGQLDHIYRYDEQENGFFDLIDGTCKRRLSRDSTLGFGTRIVAGAPFDLQIRTGQGRAVINLIELATRVSPKQLMDLAPDKIELKYTKQGKRRQIYYRGKLLAIEKVEREKRPQAAPA